MTGGGWRRGEKGRRTAIGRSCWFLPLSNNPLEEEEEEEEEGGSRGSKAGRRVTNRIPILPLPPPFPFCSCFQSLEREKERNLRLSLPSSREDVCCPCFFFWESCCCTTMGYCEEHESELEREIDALLEKLIFPKKRTKKPVYFRRKCTWK